MHKKTNLFLGGLVGSTVVAGMALASSGAGAARWTDATASVTVESTCSMTATIAQGDEHTATLVNGTYSGGQTAYQNGIGKTTIQTFCNDQGGYAIYAIGYTNNELGNNKMEGAGLGSAYDIVTGTATSAGAQDVSNWAMKVSAVSGTYAPTILNGFSSFSAVPSTYTKVARLDKATDSSAGTNLGSSIETTYAAYISNTQPAGTYTGQVKYALVHPGTSASPNAYVLQEIADWKGELLPGIQYTAVDNRDGKTYTVALLAVDEDNDGQLEDNEYNEIWMTQNLDLCIGCDGTQALTSENTDLRQYDTNGDGSGTTFTDYAYDGTKITWSPTASNSNSTLTGSPKTITFPTSGTTGSLNADWGNNYNAPRMAEGSDTIMYKGGTRYITDETKTALAKCEAAGHSETDCIHYRVGNYYNWSAAVAMSGTSSYTAKSTVMPNSICPKGWRLPDGPVGNNTISDFNTLLNVYNISNGNDYGTESSSVNVGFKTDGLNKIESAPLYFARSGGVTGSTLYNFSSFGFYWSSTVFSSGSAYYLDYSSGGLYPAYRYGRFSGWSVRCMAR